MSSNAQIRLASVRDAATLLDWYGPLITETAISMETRPLTLIALQNRIRSIMARYPWLVCEMDDALAGFSYAGPHRGRPGYLWSVETAIYVSPRYRRRGVARGLYRSLLGLLELQGFRMAYAGITIPNQASVQLHESLGFELVGIYRNAGHKLGKWHDAGWWQLQLGSSLPDEPEPPLTPERAARHSSWQTLLQAGLAEIR